jgi:hypothetical protein
MDTNVTSQEARVLDFIDNLNKLREQEKEREIQNSSPDMKLRKLNSEVEKGKSYCIDGILGRIYKDALPFEDPQKNCPDDTARGIMHDFIAARTGGKGSEYYVREAIRRNNSPTLKNIMDGVNDIVKEFYAENAKNIGVIKIEDLDFNNNMPNEKLDRLGRNVGIDEIAELIRDNVNDTLKNEADRAKREEEYRQEIEDQLSQDLNVTDDASMESAVDKILSKNLRQPRVYQPSLFEAITVGKTSVMTESSMEDVMTESIREYTKLNIIKALALESFNLKNIKDMANNYLRG